MKVVFWILSLNINDASLGVSISVTVRREWRPDLLLWSLFCKLRIKGVKAQDKKLEAKGFGSKDFTALLLLKYTFFNSKTIIQIVQCVDRLLWWTDVMLKWFSISADKIPSYNSPMTSRYISKTHYTEQSPSWEGDSSLVSQEIPRILYNPKVNYHIHKGPPPVPTLRDSSPIQAASSPVLEDPSDLPTKTLRAPLLSPAVATSSAHIILDLITRIIFDD